MMSDVGLLTTLSGFVVLAVVVFRTRSQDRVT